MKLTTPLFRAVLLVLATAIPLSGCSWMNFWDDTPETVPGMYADVDLRSVHRCSRLSPRISVQNAPKGTYSYEVRLVEYKGPDEVYLGGGSWIDDGSGVIPEGGMTRHYRGPCPQNGMEGKYAFVIAAMPKGVQQPLAVHFHRFTQE